MVAQADDAAEEVVTETQAETASAPAESSASAAASGDEVELSKISVTGSRIKRTDVEGPQPLTIITSDDIDQGGFLSVYEAVAQLHRILAKLLWMVLVEAVMIVLLTN